MRNYEILLMFHPNHSERIPAMIERYAKVIGESGGQIFRQENWGRLALSFPIQKQIKAHYMLLNLETTIEALGELKHLFRFNDALLRHLILTEEFDGLTESVFVKNQRAEKANQERRANRTNASHSPRDRRDETKENKEGETQASSTDTPEPSASDAAKEGNEEVQS